MVLGGRIVRKMALTDGKQNRQRHQDPRNPPSPRLDDVSLASVLRLSSKQEAP